MLRNAMGSAGVSFSGKKHYEGVRFNVISVMRGWVGVNFPGKKYCVTLEWPLLFSLHKTKFRFLTFPAAAHLLPILSLSGVDRNDCISPCFSVLCELWIKLVLSQIAPHSVHPPQSRLSSRSLPSHLYCCYLLCNVRIFSSHHMAIPRKAFLGDRYVVYKYT